MATHLVFGLRLACARTLPGLVPFAGDEVDVHVSLEPATGAVCQRALDGATGPVVSQGANAIHVQYADGVAFTIRRDGGRVEGTWSAGQTVEDAVCYLVGPILRTVLRLRGVPVLHGSAVALDGDAIALVGPSGAGKSTTAAALVAAGATLVTDDTVTLARVDDDFHARPGYCGVRLWSDVAPTVCALDQLDPITPTWDKRFLRVTGFQLQREPARLRAVYLLAPRQRRGMHLVEPLRGADALVALAANVGVTYADDRALRAQTFAVLADLVDRVPVRRLTPRADLSQAITLAEAVLEDTRRLLSGVG